MLDQPLGHAQVFQQAIETTSTCRSIIKYNSTLSEEQKAEVLADIENMLANMLTFLETKQVASPPRETPKTPQPQQAVDLLIDDEDGEEDEELFAISLPENLQVQPELLLKNLYQLYCAHFKNEHSGEFETRYRVVMGVLDQLEELAGQRHDTTSGDLTTEDMLRRIRSFISSLYYPLRELTILLSNILEGKNIEMDTEALALLKGDAMQESSLTNLYDITPLLHVYNAHRQFQEHEGLLSRATRDATLFLIFLEECLEPTFNRREKIVGQIKTTAGLLNELTQLLAAYEQAMSTILAA
ncbi:MAG TPA: hypothetical protein VFN35_27395 [Ktedonobacteraceae bacterium]|nr:hypothetical protein [Ktedonobacteraceae bacterium]